MVYVVIRKQEKMSVHFKKQAQIKAQVRALLFNKAPTEVLMEYSDYSNVFSVEYAAKLPENTGMNEHAIKLEESKQPLFRPIYSLESVELEILKTYIKINLTKSFIQLSKSLAEVSILFDKKPNRNLGLYMDYWDLNNLTIKN